MILRPPRSTRTDTLFPSRRSSDLDAVMRGRPDRHAAALPGSTRDMALEARALPQAALCARQSRSEEHTSELQSLMRISYAVFCLKKKNCDTDIQRTNSARV